MIVAIFGVGLIGGSIGLALKKSRFKIKKIIGLGRNIKRLKIAQKLGAIDEFTTNFQKAVRNADIIFICFPVALIPSTVKKILPFCKKEAVITDVGSVKQSIVKEIENYIFSKNSSGPAFIGGHPIAGSEKTSVKYASENLFKNAVVVLTPTKTSGKNSLKKIKQIWENMNAKVRIMSPEKHDKILSFTSHLPHVIAFSLVNTVDNLEYTGGGFKDTTRIASSDFMWADIIWENRSNIIYSIRKFKQELLKIEKSKSKSEMLRIFRKAKNKRDTLRPSK